MSALIPHSPASAMPERSQGFVTGAARLRLWQQHLLGKWKDRPSDPGKELERMRAEWDRDLPSSR